MNSYGVIYLARCTITGDEYIGMTSDFERRKKQHLSSSKRESKRHFKFYNALRKYGAENFEWKIVDWSSSIEGLMQQEIRWIRKRDTFHNGLNCAPGGEGFCSGEDHPFFGKHHSKEHRERQSLASKGKPKSASHRRSLRKAFEKRPPMPMRARKTISEKTRLYWEAWRKANGKTINKKYLR